MLAAVCCFQFRFPVSISSFGSRRGPRSRCVSPHLSLDFLKRDDWRARNISCAVLCAFRKFQRTFHDWRTAAGDGVSADERWMERFRENRVLAGVGISACTEFPYGAEPARYFVPPA